MAQASVEKLEHTGRAERKEWLQCHRERAVGKYARAAFAKRKRNRAVSSEHRIVRETFSAREVKRTAAEERESDEYSFAEGQSESKQKAKPSQ